MFINTTVIFLFMPYITLSCFFPIVHHCANYGENGDGNYCHCINLILLMNTVMKMASVLAAFNYLQMNSMNYFHLNQQVSIPKPSSLIKFVNTLCFNLVLMFKCFVK